MLAALVGCGGSAAPEPSVGGADGPHAKKKSQTWGELGILDVKKVDEVFGGLKDSLEGCMGRGNKFASGTVTYALRVDHSGNVKYAFIKDSDLGDRAIEKCMLGVLRKATWPSPEEGDDGLIEKPITFPDREERPPEDWQQDRILPSLAKLKPKLQACRDGHAGSYRASMIVETSGKVAAVGVSAPDDKSEAIIDCMVEQLRTLKLPSPGSWPARVAFEVP
jgi:hypothetical protein